MKEQILIINYSKKKKKKYCQGPCLATPPDTRLSRLLEFECRATTFVDRIFAKLEMSHLDLKQYK